MTDTGTAISEATPVQRCGAKLRNGGTCKTWPVRGTKRCRMHGGTQPVGVASVHFKHGRYSAARYRLGGALGEAYRRHLEDTDYLALNQELALVSAQVDEVSERLAQLRPLEPERLAEGGPCDQCGNLPEAHPVFDPFGSETVPMCRAHKPKLLDGFSYEERKARLQDIGALQVRLHALIEQRRKLTETEVYRVKTAQDSMSADTARLVGHALLVALREESGDLELVKRVQERTLLVLASAGINLGQREGARPAGRAPALSAARDG